MTDRQEIKDHLKANGLLVKDLATGTGGTSFQTSDPSADFANGLVNIVLDACRTAIER